MNAARRAKTVDPKSYLNCFLVFLFSVTLRFIMRRIALLLLGPEARPVTGPVTHDRLEGNDPSLTPDLHADPLTGLQGAERSPAPERWAPGRTGCASSQ